MNSVGYSTEVYGKLGVVYQFRRSMVDLRRLWGWFERHKLPLESNNSIDFRFGGSNTFGSDFCLHML